MFPGHIIANRYRVLRVLGRGGMGVVSEVESIDDGEHFAIKFLREDVESDMQPNARFLREAKLALRLQSPHACRVLSIGEWELGPYIVMELLEGRSLNGILERGRKLEWKQAVRIAHEMCEALAEAHHLRIVHRDVKPGNVYLARSGGRVITKMLDFGVAKIPASVVTKHGEPSLTDASTLLGTPSYVAPEQLINSKLVDARADVWAVGVMLYEMLSGQLPFSSPLVPKLLVMIAREEPVPLGPLVTEVPLGLVQVVERCLQKDPFRRFEDAGALACALEPWVDDGDDLLVPLLRIPSLRPSFRPSDIPISDPPHAGVPARRSSDSLGPQTTANLGKRAHSRRTRLRYVASGVLVGLLGTCLHFANLPQPAPTNVALSMPANPPPSANVHHTWIVVEPPGARIEFDGVVIDQNPAQISRTDDGRSHELVVSADGYLTARHAFRFNADQRLTIALRSLPAQSRQPSVVPRKTKVATAPTPTTLSNSAGAMQTKTRPLDHQNPF